MEKPRILIVDDSAFNRKLLDDIISNLGYSSFLAENGKAALKILCLNDIDLVLLDVVMPEMDGYTLCEFMKNEHKLEDIPVIFITSREENEDVAKCFAVGGVDYLPKPVNPVELEARVKTHLDLRKSRTRLTHFNEQLLKTTNSLFEANKTILNKNLELETYLKKLEDTQLQLLHKEKVSGVGQLAAGAAHEINTPLGFVTSNFDTLRKYIIKFIELINIYDTATNVTFPDIKEYKTKNHIDYICIDIFELLNDTKDGLERVGSIVSSLRAFSKLDQLNEFSQYDINKGIIDTLNIARIEVMNYANIIESLNSKSEVLAVGSDINHTILNIIMNAVYAIKIKDNLPRGLISINTYETETHVICEIKDNGIGIPSELRSEIFQPFFTTKPIEDGVGLGLSFARDTIVNKHKGILLVESDLGNFSCFTIKLPKGN